MVFASTTRPLRADARRNRERIFAAAKACFAERGAAVLMEDVARAAGVGVGSMYRAFGSRAGLAEAIYRETLDELVEKAERSAGGLQAWDALESWLSAYVDELHAKRTMLSELRPLFERDPNLLRDARAQALAALEIVLGRTQQAGSARLDVDAHDLMQLVNGAVAPAVDDLPRAQRLLHVILDGLRS